MIVDEVQYNVVCETCGAVWQPVRNSPLWWYAKQFGEKNPNRLDAPMVSGEKCGCVEPRHRPNALFRVFGYNGLCEDFDIPCDTFVQAVKLYREAENDGNMVFIIGVSPAVEDRLLFGQV